jgi:hypothetical protein
MTIQYEVTQISRKRIEARAELSWYALAGYYKVSIVGFGPTEDEARQSAELMLGQARAALHAATVQDRVPETPTENADERADHRT